VWKREQRVWTAMGPGVAFMDLHRHVEGGGAALFRLEAGATIALHDHPRGEHTFVIEGELMMGEQRVRAGDALWTEPGERHVVQAITDAIFLGIAPPKRGA
jgi:quercetin dioxygenase-like cupin family protein